MDDLIIIGFSGACHSGKTQLFNKIKQYKSKYVEFLPEMIRENIKENESIDDLRQDTNRFLDMQDKIYRFNLDKLLHAQSKYCNKIVIADRTLVDNFYYTLLYLNRTDPDLNWDKHNRLWQDMLDSMELIENLYTNIFLFNPIPFNSENDKIRVKNLKDIQDLEYNTFRMLHHTNICNSKTIYKNSNFIIDFNSIELDEKYNNSLIGICEIIKENNKFLTNSQKDIIDKIIKEQM